MDAEKLDNDYRFYEGFEGEPELIFQSGKRSIHIWKGYIADIFREPVLSDGRMLGLTRDYHCFIGPFTGDCSEYAIDVAEYLEDCRRYKGRRFAFTESRLALDAMINWLEERRDPEITVRVS